jgi:dTDP-4-amino-4,6-dideoxygalactose transaminase
MIPYEDLHQVNKNFFQAFRENFNLVLESGRFILGEQVRKFEFEFARYHNILHCIGVASGLDALTLSLKAFGLSTGSEVIVPSNTYIATILSIIHAGLKPVLVEPDINTYNLDPSKIEDSISSNTRAIMVVHLYGRCCEMDEIKKLCRQHDLLLIEDCAQSHGAKYKDQLSGTFGDCAAFSFYPTKNLGGLGDGGAVLCTDEKIAALIRSLRNYGSSKKYNNEYTGYNSRLDEIQAAFLQVKLKSLDEINAHKRKLAALYLNHLNAQFTRPATDPDHFDVYHIFTVRHPARNELREYLLRNGIETEIHYPIPPHHQKAFKSIFNNSSFPISELIHNTILSLPCSFAHTEENIYHVIETINNF